MSNIVVEALREMRDRLEHKRSRLVLSRAKTIQEMARFGNRHRLPDLERALDAINKIIESVSEKIGRVDYELNKDGTS